MAVTYPTAPTAVSINPATSTSTVNVTSGNATSLQTAFTNAALGQEIVIPVATYTGNFTLPVPATGVGVGGGTGQVSTTSSPASTTGPTASSVVATVRPAVSSSAENFVTIRSANSSSLPDGTRVTSSNVNFAKLVGSTSAAVLTLASAAHHYRFIGIEVLSAATIGVAAVVSAGPGGGDQTTASNYMSKVSFERCYFHANYDFGCTKGINMGGADMQIIDSVFDEIKQIGQGDANCIWLSYGGTGPYKIHNNNIAGMGENVFTGGSSDVGVAVTAGYEYVIPKNITITNNYMRRKLSWKSDDATYLSPCDTAGTGTVSSSGTTLTFSNSQSGLVGKYVKGLTSGAVVKINSGSGTSWVAASTPSPAFSAESFRTNSGALSAKNVLEFKAGQYILIENNYFENIWPDGQQFDLTLTPREFGWISDVEVRYNRFTSCSGPSLGVGDPNAGSGFGPSPYPLSRLWIHHNQWDQVKTTALSSLSSRTYCSFISTGTDTYGTMQSAGTSIAAGATTGTGVTFTGVGSPFAASVVGNQIAYLTGRGTITAYTDANHITVTITSAFADITAHAVNLWYIAKTGMVATAQLVPDSWVIEHNSWIGASSAFNVTHLLYKNTTGGNETSQKGTNFIYRNNIAWHGSDPSNEHGGIKGDNSASIGTLLGTGAISRWWDTATAVVTNNVFFGTQLFAGANDSQYYTGSQLGGPGPNSFASTIKTAFHDPDTSGGNGGSTAIGFTDYAGGNYLLTGTYATAATDGTMIGPDTVALASRLSGVTS